MNRYFSKEDIHEANKHMKKCSSLVTGEVHIKTTLRYHVTLVRMAIIKKSGDNRCWRGCGEIETLLYCWWECKLVQSLWKTVWQFLKDLEIEIPFDPAIPFLGIYPKNYKLFYYKYTCITAYNSKDLKPTQMFINDRLDKEMWHMYTMEYYAAMKIDEFMSFIGTWINLEILTLSKLTQGQKTKHCMLSLIGRC